MLSENVKIIMLRAPVADCFNGDPLMAAVGVANYRKCTFVVSMGVNTGTTGRVKMLAYAADVSAGTNKTEVGYWMRTGTGSAPDTLGALTRVEAGATAAIAAANCVATQHIIEVDVEEAKKLQEAAGFAFNGIALQCDETVDDPIVGSVLCILSEPRNAGATMPIVTIA